MDKHDKYLEELEFFLGADLRIKQMMLECAPNELDKTDKIGYYKKLRLRLNSIYILLSRFLLGPFFTEEKFLDTICKRNGIKVSVETIKSNALQIVRKKIIDLERKLRNSEFMEQDLNEIYTQIFSNMDNELLRNVRGKLYGFNASLQYEFENVLRGANSINEILHVLHAYVENNQDILDSLQPIKIKEQPEMRNAYYLPQKFDCRLYGHKDNKLANEIFNELDILSYSYIVALDDKIMMMVRDYGHALTLQITQLDDDTVQVEYYIPDLKDNVNIAGLPTLMPEIQQTLDQSANKATGRFIVNRNSAANVVCSFIDLIPKDYGLEQDVKCLLQVSSEDKALSLVKEGKISPKLLLLHLRHTKISNPTEKFLNTLRNAIEETRESSSNPNPAYWSR